MRAVGRVKDDAVISDIEAALRQGNIEAAIDALRLDPPAFREMEDEIRLALIAGGDDVAKYAANVRDPEGRRLAIRFDVRNPSAEQYLRANSSDLVTNIIREQRDALRIALREGLERGDNPRTVALDLIGRINKQTGRREGGIVGLSQPFERAVSKARDDLKTGNYTAYLQRERRDKRYDKMIARAIRDDKPLKQSEIDKIVARYSDNLLMSRGETIGRTEAMSALMRGKYLAFQQMIEEGKVRAQDVRKVWQATFDRRVRDTHAILDKKSVAFNEPFVSTSGARLLHPMDRSLGARAAEIINCRCNLKMRIDFLSKEA